MNSIIRQYAQLMCSRQHTQRPVSRRRIIQMNTQRQNSLQSRRGSVGVENASLYRPWSPSRRLPFLSDWKSRVLMPNDKPIRFGRFRKKSSAERTGFRSQRLPSDVKEPRIQCQVQHVWIAESVPHSSTTAMLFIARETTEKGAYFARTKHVRENRETVILYAAAHLPKRSREKNLRVLANQVFLLQR